MMQPNEIAAAIHADMVNDDRNGYSQGDRWGGSETKTLYFDGLPYTYHLGDYDCSSSCITAWRLALQYTKYVGVLDAANSTRDMRQVFVSSGLFEEWDTNKTYAQPGDLYLNDKDHVAMCQSPDNPDTLSEFVMGDNGITGNVPGDQSGWEAYIRDYYNFPWNVTIHYNGKADIDDMTLEELMYKEIATADSGNIPIWEAWSWAYTYAKRANEKCAKLEKRLAALEKKAG